MIAPLTYRAPGDASTKPSSCWRSTASDARPHRGRNGTCDPDEAATRATAGLVALDGIEELRRISATDDGVRIGATATHREVEISPVVADARAPARTHAQSRRDDPHPQRRHGRRQRRARRPEPGPAGDADRAWARR